MKLVKGGTTNWESGSGYRKSRLASFSDLHCEGTLVQLLSIDAGQHVARHVHEHAVEAFYFISGRAIFTLDEVEVPVEPGDLLICHPGEVHSVDVHSSGALHYIVFKTNWKDGDSTWLS